MAVASPTARTLSLLRDEGWLADRKCIVEGWERCGKGYGPRSWRRKDYLGCVDIIAVKGLFTLAIQATDYSDISKRVKKALAEPRLVPWLHPGSGRTFEVWGWHKKNGRWACRVVTVRPLDKDPMRLVAVPLRSSLVV